jgi:hypothetical protein
MGPRVLNLAGAVLVPLGLWILLMEVFPDLPFMRWEWSGTVAALVFAGAGFVFVAREYRRGLLVIALAYFTAMTVFLIGVCYALAALHGRLS